MNYSVTQASNIAQFLGVVFMLFGTPVDSTELDAFAKVLGLLLSLGAPIVSYINRYRKGDVTTLGRRK
jgi:hypothetical protein